MVFLKRRNGVSEPAVYRSSTQNKCFLIFHKIQSKKSALEPLFNKAAVLRACNFIKEDSNTGGFLWIFGIIHDHLFCRGSTNG